MNKQKKRVLRLEKKWRSRLRLFEWQVRFDWAEGPIVSQHDPASLAVATADVDWQYRSAVLTWNLKGVADLSDAELERIFVHECMHIIVAEMRDWSIPHEERVVETLTWIITEYGV